MSYNRYKNMVARENMYLDTIIHLYEMQKNTTDKKLVDAYKLVIKDLNRELEVIRMHTDSLEFDGLHGIPEEELVGSDTDDEEYVTPWEEDDTDEDYTRITCVGCHEDKKVEKGTYALEYNMCERCYCAYQGG